MLRIIPSPGWGGESLARKTSSGHVSFAMVVTVVLPDAAVAGSRTALGAPSWCVEQNPGLADSSELKPCLYT